MTEVRADAREAKTRFRWGEIELAESFRCLLSPMLLEHPLPAVPRVDCGSCRRVREGTAQEEVRCCDVVPVLPNFLVGEILTQTSHPVVLDWVASRRGDPYAIWVPPEVAERHRNARKDGLYGLPCPLLVPGEGRCSVYAQRPALCVSYHCYYPSVLWREAWSCLASTLELLQDAASRLLVARSDLDLQAMASLWEEEPESLWEGGQQIPSFYEGCWQHWVGREADFYRGCFRRLRQEASSLFWDIRDLQRQQLLERMRREGQLTSALQREVDREFVQRRELVVTPLVPSASLRERLRQGAIPAERNLHTIHQQESILLWYVEQLTSPPWGQWWRRMWRGKQEVQDTDGIGGERG